LFEGKLTEVYITVWQMSV